MPEQFRQDARFALRVLVKDRGFATVAIAILAIGIGATVAMFSVIDATLLRSLPYPAASRVVAVWETNAQQHLDRFPASGPNFLDWREQNTVFDAMAAFELREANFSGAGTPDRVHVAAVSPSTFRLLGVSPVIGRPFDPENDAAPARTAILSDALWRTRFGAAPDVLGSTVSIDGTPYAVVGVMDASVTFPEGAQLWVPLDMGSAGRPDQRASHGFNVIGRLKTGVSLQQAQREMTTLAARLASTYPGSNTGWTVTLVDLKRQLVGDTRTALISLFGAVFAVLLIACANVGNLLVTRAVGRTREMTVRAALGAERRRIIRQLLTESFVLVAAAGVLGVLLAYAGTRLVSRIVPAAALGAVPSDIVPSWTALVFAIGITAATGIVFGLAPAFAAGRTDVADALRSGRGLTESGRLHGLRGALTVMQLALSLALLVGTGLLLKSLARLQHDDVGFQMTGRVAMDISLAGAAYAQPSQRAARYRALIDGLERVPGVQSAALVRLLPLVPHLTAFNSFGIEGHPAVLAGQDLPTAYQRPITEAYFATMGIPLLRGRIFRATDDANAPLVAIVDSAAIKRYWPGEHPVGRRIYFDRREGRLWLTIVGVTGSVKHDRTAVDAAPTVYVPLAQWPWSEMTVVLRSNLPPGALATPVRRVVQTADPQLPVSNVRSLDSVAADAMWRPRFGLMLLGAFAGVALFLAALGVYAVISYDVLQRRREMALRMALGGTPGRVTRLVLQRSVGLATAGVGFGATIAIGATRAMSALLYGVSPLDSGTYLAVGALLILVSVAAAAIPARRASRVQMGEVLRAE